MTLGPVKIGGWVSPEQLTHIQISLLQDLLGQALDAINGGDYTAAENIIMRGAPFVLGGKSRVGKQMARNWPLVSSSSDLGINVNDVCNFRNPTSKKIGYLVASGDGAAYLVGYDGAGDWSSDTYPGSITPLTLCSNADGTVVVGGGGTKIHRTLDIPTGVGAWTEELGSAGGTVSWIDRNPYTNRFFAAVDNTATVQVSDDDGDSWSAKSLGGAFWGATSKRFAFSPDRVICVSANGSTDSYAYSDDDGDTWSIGTFPSTQSMYGCVYDAVVGLWVVSCGTTLFHSASGDSGSWSSVSLAGQGISTLTSHHGLFLAIDQIAGSANTCMRYVDLDVTTPASWQAQSIPGLSWAQDTNGLAVFPRYLHLVDRFAVVGDSQLGLSLAGGD